MTSWWPPRAGGARCAGCRLPGRRGRDDVPGYVTAPGEPRGLVVDSRVEKHRLVGDGQQLFGRVCVIGRNRVPEPPASTRAFMALTVALWCYRQKSIASPQDPLSWAISNGDRLFDHAKFARSPQLAAPMTATRTTDVYRLRLGSPPRGVAPPRRDDR